MITIFTTLSVDIICFRGVLVDKIIPDPENLDKFCLPLEVFDNTDFDERLPAEWRSLAPLPCLVLHNSTWVEASAVGILPGSTDNGSSGTWEVSLPDNKGELGRMAKLI